jgi:hypothetical protein
MRLSGLVSHRIEGGRSCPTVVVSHAGIGIGTRDCRICVRPPPPPPRADGLPRALQHRRSPPRHRPRGSSSRANPDGCRTRPCWPRRTHRRPRWTDPRIPSRGLTPPPGALRRRWKADTRSRLPTGPIASWRPHVREPQGQSAWPPSRHQAPARRHPRICQHIGGHASSRRCL